MQKNLGAIFLIAGTAVGAGILALPLSLSALGLLPSLALMVVVWGVVLVSAFVILELNLQLKKALPVGQLGLEISGRGAQQVGDIGLLFLMYSLLAAYIYAGGSLLEGLLSEIPGFEFSRQHSLAAYCVVGFLVLSLKIKGIDSLNRFLFCSLINIFFHGGGMNWPLVEE